IADGHLAEDDRSAHQQSPDGPAKSAAPILGKYAASQRRHTMMLTPHHAWITLVVAVSCSCAGTPPSSRARWQLVWHDEFDGTALDAGKWVRETGGGGWGNEIGRASCRGGGGGGRGGGEAGGG